jgi:hypothetical protein
MPNLKKWREIIKQFLCRNYNRLQKLKNKKTSFNSSRKAIEKWLNRLLKFKR